MFFRTLIVNCRVVLRSVQHCWHLGHEWKLSIPFMYDQRVSWQTQSLATKVDHHHIYLYQLRMTVWRLALRIMQPLSIVTADRAKAFWNIRAFKYSLVPMACTSLYFLFHQKELELDDDDLLQKEQLFEPLQEGRIVSAAKYIGRFVQLGIIFAPSIICLPLYLFSGTRDWWLSLFLSAVQRAGVVWIKTFQYLSHRRDVIGEEMAKKFQVLREHAPQHQFSQTQRIIRRTYGMEIEEMFQEFDTKPIASGSVGQVYKAKLNGKEVAVKVRHPQVGLNIQRDIEIMFAFSRGLSKLSKIFEVPVTSYNLKRILSSQISFLRQKRNIDAFNKIVVDKDLKFPETYEQSTNQVLIQEFIEGQTIGFYESNKHNMNKVIANLGAKAFFAMLLKNNFIHADCHAGNIMVRIKQNSNPVVRHMRSFFDKARNFVISQVIKYGFDSEYLRKLSEQHYEYEKGVQDLVDEFKQRVEIILIDVGMALRLTAEKKKNFQNFLAQIIKGDPIQCAKWIYRVSQFNGVPLKQFQNQIYLKDLQVMFRRVHQTTLDSLQGIEVLVEMLEVIRNHNMKIDGQISILLTNMLVLESIAKDLDPNINILRCAVPYLHYK